MLSWVRGRPRTAGLAGIAVVLGSVLLTMVDGSLPTDRMGVLGEWLAGTATIVAVIVALDAENRAEQRRQAERRRSAARSVVLSNLRAETSGTDVRFVVDVANFGPTPIREVRLEVDLDDDAVGRVGELYWPDPNAGGVYRTIGLGKALFLAGAMGPNGALTKTGVGPLIAEHFELSDLRRWGARFIDVHGDEWLVWFGSKYGTRSEARRISNGSGFWPTHEDPPSHFDRGPEA